MKKRKRRTTDQKVSDFTSLFAVGRIIKCDRVEEDSNSIFVLTIEYDRCNNPHLPQNFFLSPQEDTAKFYLSFTLDKKCTAEKKEKIKNFFNNLICLTCFPRESFEPWNGDYSSATETFIAMSDATNNLMGEKCGFVRV